MRDLDVLMKPGLSLIPHVGFAIIVSVSALIWWLFLSNAFWVFSMYWSVSTLLIAVDVFSLLNEKRNIERIEYELKLSARRRYPECFKAEHAWNFEHSREGRIFAIENSLAGLVSIKLAILTGVAIVWSLN